MWRILGEFRSETRTALELARTKRIAEDRDGFVVKKIRSWRDSASRIKTTGKGSLVIQQTARDKR